MVDAPPPQLVRHHDAGEEREARPAGGVAARVDAGPGGPQRIPPAGLPAAPPTAQLPEVVLAVRAPVDHREMPVARGIRHDVRGNWNVHHRAARPPRSGEAHASMGRPPAGKEEGHRVLAPGEHRALVGGRPAQPADHGVRGRAEGGHPGNPPVEGAVARVEPGGGQPRGAQRHAGARLRAPLAFGGAQQRAGRQHCGKGYRAGGRLPGGAADSHVATVASKTATGSSGPTAKRR